MVERLLDDGAKVVRSEITVQRRWIGGQEVVPSHIQTAVHFVSTQTLC